MSGSTEQFHDPELKAAIVRLRGGHQIRPDLRASILRRLEEQRAEIGASDGAGDDGNAVAEVDAEVIRAGDAGGGVGGDGANETGRDASDRPESEPSPVMREVEPAADQEPLVQEQPQEQPHMRLAGDAADLKLATAARVRPEASRGGFRLPHWIATAAVLLIVVGTSTVYWRHVKHEQEEREEYLAENRPLLEAMIAAHEAPAANSGNAGDSAAANLADPAAVSAEFQGKLGRYVPVVHLTGWKLESASLTQVAGARGARWRMSNGERTLTVLSLPREAFKGEEGYDEYDFVLDKHAIAGYVRDGGIHCIVGDPTMTPAESIALREELRHG